MYNRVTRFLRSLRETLTLVRIIIIGSIAEIGYLYYKVFSNVDSNDEENIDKTVVVITGAQQGIGKSMATEFAKRGAIVVMGCVDLTEGQKAQQKIKMLTGNHNIDLLHLDLSEMKSVREFASKLKDKYPEIKILLNNAGLGGAPNGNVKTKDGFNLHMAVNYLGHFLLTNLLVPNMKRGSRVVSVSSSLQLLARLDLDDFMMDKTDLRISFDTGLPYANSKFALSLFTKELGEKLKGQGVTTYSVCPGIVKTTIYQTANIAFRAFANIFGLTPEQACLGILHCALDKKLGQETGKMYRYKGQYLEANSKLDPVLTKQLWELSAKLVEL